MDVTALITEVSSYVAIVGGVAIAALTVAIVPKAKAWISRSF